jgi:LysR family glycine cleavage system transcriptional activator
MRKLPPLIQLRAFEVTARLLSFKKAAEELNVSATAISHQIKLLEEYCDCSLFRRRPRPIALTRAGESLFPIVEKGLDEFSRALENIRADQVPENLVLTTTSSFATKWLTPNLSAWRKLYPSLSLEIIATDSVVDLQVEADFSVRYMNEPADTSVLTNRELVRDNFVAVCNPELLTNNQAFQTLEELADCTLIHTHWSPDDLTAPTWERWARLASEAYAESMDLQKSHHLTFHEEVQAIDAVIGGAGVLIVSDFLIAREIQDGVLVKALDFTLPGHGFYLTYREDHPHRVVFDTFGSWAQELISDSNYSN